MNNITDNTKKVNTKTQKSLAGGRALRVYGEVKTMVNNTEKQQKSTSLGTVAQHNLSSTGNITKGEIYTYQSTKPYGVQATSRIINKSVFIKRHDAILGYLRQMGLTKKQSWAVIRLLRFWVYYGKAYPKAETVCGGDKVLNTGTMKIETIGAYCSIRSFWYAVKYLEEQGLIERVKQFINHYQTSSYYLLDKLVLYIATRMCEHGQIRLGKFSKGIVLFFWKNQRCIKEFNVNLSLEAPVKLLA